MATVMSQPPSLPDRGNRPAPPSLNKLPSRSRPGTTSNINRPLPSVPQDNTFTKPQTRPCTAYQNNGNRVPASSHPIHSSHTMPRNQRDLPRIPSADPPPVPPRRPESTTHSNKPKKAIRGFEEKFHFHKLNDFPEPDDFSGKKKKYTSITPGQNGQRRTSPAN